MDPNNIKKPGASDPPSQKGVGLTFSEQVLFLAPHGKRDAFRSWYQYTTAVKAGTAKPPSMWKTGALSLPDFVVFDGNTTDAEESEDEERDMGEPMPMQVFGGTIRKSGALGGSDPLFRTGSNQQRQKVDSNGKMMSVFHYCGDMWLMEEKPMVGGKQTLLVFCQGCAICAGVSADASYKEQGGQQPADVNLWESMQVSNSRSQQSSGVGIREETRNVLHYYDNHYVIETRARDPRRPFLMMDCDGCSKCDVQSAEPDPGEGNDGRGVPGENVKGGMLAPSAAAAGGYGQTTGTFPALKPPHGAESVHNRADSAAQPGRSIRSQKQSRRCQEHGIRQSQQKASQQTLGMSGTKPNPAPSPWAGTGTSAQDRRSEHLWPIVAKRGAFQSIERRFERTEGGSHRNGGGYSGGRSTKSV